MSFLSSTWFKTLEHIAPLILAATPAAPLAPFVQAGIAAAEQIPGASGASKKALVKQLVVLGSQATDAQTGKPLLDPAAVAAISDEVIDSIVDTTNVVHAAQQSVATK